jgi:hypothetical protein
MDFFQSGRQKESRASVETIEVSVVWLPVCLIIVIHGFLTTFTAILVAPNLHLLPRLPLQTSHHPAKRIRHVRFPRSYARHRFVRRRTHLVVLHAQGSKSDVSPSTVSFAYLLGIVAEEHYICENSLIRTSLMLSITCCYLMWAITYMAQLHPLMGKHCRIYVRLSLYFVADSSGFRSIQHQEEATSGHQSRCDQSVTWDKAAH